MSYRHSLRSIYGVSLASLGWLVSSGLMPPIATPAYAQSVVEATDGTGTTVETDGNFFSISGGTLSGNNQNLFHSFEFFNLTTDATAQFILDANIQNILGRVVGEQPSIINGTLQVIDSDANLFLMNPAGIFFGADAQLNVLGDFTATTATGIGFEDGWFNATGDNDYAALGDDPTQFAFATNQPGSIFNEGTLAVESEQTLMLMGGAIVNTGTLQAPNGRVVMTAVPGEQLVTISREDMVLTLAIDPLEDAASATANDGSSPTPLPYTPLTLSALLTGGQDQGHANDVDVRDDGSIVLTASDTTIDSAWAEAETDPSIVTLDNQAEGDNATIQTTDETRLAVNVVKEASFVAPTGSRGLVVYGSTILSVPGHSGETPTDNGNPDHSEVDVSNTELPNDSILDNSDSDGTLVEEAIDSSLDNTIDSELDPESGSSPLSGTLPSTEEAPGPSSGALPNASDSPGPSLGALPNVSDRPPTVTETTDGGTTETQTGTQDTGTQSGTITTTGPVESIISIEVGHSLLDTNATSGPEGGTASPVAPVSSPSIDTLDVDGDALIDSQAPMAEGIGTESVDPTVDTTVVSIEPTNSVESIVTPEVNTPEVNTPEVNTPEVNTSEVNTSEVNTPEVNTPEVNTPEVNTPEVNTSEVNTSEVNTPEVGTPEIGTPEIVTTEVGTPETTTPESPTPVATAEGGSVSDPITDDGARLVLPVTELPNSVEDGESKGDVNVDSEGGGSDSLDPYTSDLETPLETPNSDGDSVAIATESPSAPVESVGVVAGIKIPKESTRNETSQADDGASSSQQEQGQGPHSADLTETTQATSESSALDYGSSDPPPEGVTPVEGAEAGPDVASTPPATEADPSSSSTTAATSPSITHSPSATPSEASTTESASVDTSTEAGESTAAAESSGTDSADGEGSVDSDSNGDHVGVPQYAFPHNGVNVAIGEAGVAIASLEQQRNDDLVSYFGRDLDVADVTPETVQTLLSHVNQETGNRAAIVYVTAPQSLPYFSQKPGQDSQEVAYVDGSDPSSLHPETLKQAAWKRDTVGPTVETPLELLVFTLDGAPLRIRVPGVSREHLFETITQFRNDLVLSERRGTNHYLPTSQRLYQWLIAPLEAELGPDAVETFLFAMDSGLRGLPIAALHDGEQFVVEKYSVGMVPSLGVMTSQYSALNDADVLAMGAETFKQQAPLPAVPVEVNTITEMQGGRVFLNEAFTQHNLVHQQTSQPSQIIHLATHASFNPGTAEDSYIQLWGDEQLSLNEVQSLGWNNPAVALLVLSACQTAVGNAEAEMGFAGLAVAAGVQSALASLWTINDEGTLALMTEFYDQLNAVPLKSEALRQSQLAMLNGTIRMEDGHLVRGEGYGRIALPSSLGRGSDRDWSHPYYWSGFTMIGSPW